MLANKMPPVAVAMALGEVGEYGDAFRVEIDGGYRNWGLGGINERCTLLLELGFFLRVFGIELKFGERFVDMDVVSPL